MDVKLFEVRDRATFIPVMATRLTYRDDYEKYLLRRAGFDGSQIEPHSADDPYVVLWPLIGGHCTYDPYGWPGRTRTIPTVHNWLLANWNKVSSGDVIDVEFILGETETPKPSERVIHG